MCWRTALSFCSCLYCRAIPQPMPLPKVPIGVFCLSAHNFGKADNTRRRRVTSLISDIPIRKIAQKSDFSCVYQKKAVPLHRIQCKGSRWESCTVPLLWFAIRCSNSYKSLVPSELGRLNKGAISQKTCCMPPTSLVKLNALGESSQRQWRKGFQYYFRYAHMRIGIW